MRRPSACGRRRGEGGDRRRGIGGEKMGKEKNGSNARTGEGTRKQGRGRTDKFFLKSQAPSLDYCDHQHEAQAPSLDYCDHQREAQEKMKSSFSTLEYRPNIEWDWSKMFTIPRSISSILARFDYYFGKYPWYMGSVVQFLYDGCVFMMLDSPGADSSILEATHIINGKEASIKRILYVCKIPETATSEELINTFSEFGKVEECDYNVRFRTTKAGRCFALVVFDSEEVVDELAARGKIEFRGEDLEVKKAEVAIGVVETAGSSDMISHRSQIVSFVVSHK